MVKPIKLANNNFLSSLDLSTNEVLRILDLASNFKNIEGVIFFVLVSKKKPIWWKTVNLTYEKEWIVFPWESKENELKEEKQYNKKRGLK